MHALGRIARGLLVPSLVVVALAADGPVSRAGASTTASHRTAPGRRRASTGSGVVRWAGSPVSTTAIPLGDGKISARPRAGYEDSCVQSFASGGGGAAGRPPGGGPPGGGGAGGGASASVPWIDTVTNTWNLQAKVVAEGAHVWPTASHSFTVHGADRVLRTDDLPVGSTTGTFPISSSDPADRYDRNPNSVTSQNLSWTVPTNPTAASTPGCTGMGPIGVMTDGVVIFNPLDATGRDAGAHEVQDSCDGHPQMSGIYHYHDYSTCLDTAATKSAGSSTLVGYALDGFGIYVERDASGHLPTDADLDACHGRTSKVLWNGKETVVYHYDVTLEYPYLVGCFHGTAVTGTR